MAAATTVNKHTTPADKNTSITAAVKRETAATSQEAATSATGHVAGAAAIETTAEQ